MRNQKSKNKEKKSRPAAINPDLLVEIIDQGASRGYSFKQLLKRLNIEDRKGKVTIASMIDTLERQGRVTISKNGIIRGNYEQQYITGKVDYVNPRFAFIVTDELEDDVWVDYENMANALDGDVVKVALRPGRNGKRTEGEVVEIISRGRTEFVGRIEISDRHAFVIPDSRRMHYDIYVRLSDIKDAKNNEKVIVKITEWPTADRNPVGEVIKVLGPAGNNDTEMHAIMAEFGLPYEFEPEVEAEAEAIPVEIPEEEIKKRRDFRNVTTFTIDPVDAKDFDDALSIRKLENGNWEIGVHIADVTHYVKPGTLLEEEALRRATSVYLVDRTIPMLPEKLSNNLCSLRPHEDKLTFSAVFELDDDANIKSEWFGRTIIHSDRRFSYEEAQELIEGKDGDFKEEILTLNRLAYKLRDERFGKGAIGFETAEVKFKLDENGKPLAVIPKVRKDAHKLIEDFMLLANKRVAEFVYHMAPGKDKHTMIYRIHESPDPEKIRVFSQFAKRFGHNIVADEKKVAASFNKLIEDVEGKPEQDVLQNLAIRTMAKARYSTEELGHFGLAFDHYSHFTSPIRRYPDMMCHRMLQHYLDKGRSLDEDPQEEMAKHSSEMEKKAAEAERASIKYKQVEYMQLQEPGKVYEGIVSGVTEFGIYVELIETKCEGMVRMTDLNDDYYELDAENYRVIGQKTKRIINFGDKINVRVKDTNLAKRIIDLEMA